MDCHGVNGTATLQLLDVARQTDSRVVLASSAAIYGHPKTVPVGIGPKAAHLAVRCREAHQRRVRACTRSSTDWRPSRSGISTSTGRARPASTAASSASFSTRPAPATDHRRGRRRPDQDFVHVDDVVRAKTGWRRRGSTGQRVQRRHRIERHGPRIGRNRPRRRRCGRPHRASSTHGLTTSSAVAPTSRRPGKNSSSNRPSRSVTGSRRPSRSCCSAKHVRSRCAPLRDGTKDRTRLAVDTESPVGLARSPSVAGAAVRVTRAPLAEATTRRSLNAFPDK